MLVFQKVTSCPLSLSSRRSRCPRLIKSETGPGLRANCPNIYTVVTVRRHAFDRLDSLPIEKASLLYSTDVMSDTANKVFKKVTR